MKKESLVTFLRQPSNIFYRVSEIEIVGEIIRATLISHPQQSTVHRRRFLGFCKTGNGIGFRPRARQYRFLEQLKNFLLDVLVLLLWPVGHSMKHEISAEINEIRYLRVLLLTLEYHRLFRSLIEWVEHH